MAFLAILYRGLSAGGAVQIPEPKSQLTTGIYHPRADGAYNSLLECLQWCSVEWPLPPGAPL
jgi:hypothetical protein